MQFVQCRGSCFHMCEVSLYMLKYSTKMVLIYPITWGNFGRQVQHWPLSICSYYLFNWKTTTIFTFSVIHFFVPNNIVIIFCSMTFLLDLALQEYLSLVVKSPEKVLFVTRICILSSKNTRKMAIQKSISCSQLIWYDYMKCSKFYSEICIEFNGDW